MGLFDRFKREPELGIDQRLLGRWELVRTDHEFVDGKVLIEFTADGKLNYSIAGAATTDLIEMVYGIDGDVIISDQPSDPGKERTKYSFDDAGMLVLKMKKGTSWFKRLV